MEEDFFDGSEDAGRERTASGRNKNKKGKKGGHIARHDLADGGSGKPQRIAASSSSDTPTDIHAKLPSMSPTLSDLDRSILLCPRDASRPQLHSAAFRHAMVTGNYLDVVFYLPSHRDPHGAIRRYQPIWANSLVLRVQSEHFEHLFSGGFAEGLGSMSNASIEPHTSAQPEYYEYESDSDLDEDETVLEHDANAQLCDAVQGLSVADVEPVTASEGPPAASASSVSKDLVTSARTITTLGLVPSEQHNTQSASKTLPPSSFNDVPSDPTPTPRAEKPKGGHNIIVQDMAFKTWKSFVFWLQLGELEFAILKSQKIQHDKKSGLKWADCYSAPPCSPKSMYRLADKYDMKALRDLALQNIQSKLSTKNILEELFSKFTSRYTEVMTMEIDFLMQSRTHADVIASLPRWIDQVSSGDLPHCKEMLSTLMVRLARGG